MPDQDYYFGRCVVVVSGNVMLCPVKKATVYSTLHTGKIWMVFKTY